MRKLTLKTAAVCLALAAAGFSNIAGAQSISISPANSTVNTGGGATSPAGIDVVFTAGGAPAVTGYQTDIDFDNTQMSVALTNGNATSCVLFDVNTVRILDFDAGGAALPTGTACTLTFTVNAGQTGGTVYPVNVNGTACSDAGGNPVPCTETDGTITVVATSSPTITFAPPPPGPVTFPAGAAGSTNTQTIDADGTGGTAGESTTVENCVVTGTGLALGAFTPFTVNNGDPSGDVDGTIPVQCTYAAGSPRTGTLTCDVNPTLGATTQATWNLSCPAGGATPPSIAYNPPAGSTITIVGAAGSTQTGSVQVTQTATGQAGTDVTVDNCVATAGFSAPTGDPIVINGGTAGQGGTISTTCTIPATAPDLTGTLTCDEIVDNGTGTSTTPRTWNLVCQTPSPEFSSSPQSGGTVTLTGAPTTTVTGSIPVTNVGLADLTVTGCAITGDPVTFPTVPTSPGTIAPNATVPIGFSCVAPSAAGTTVTGTLTCTTNDTTDGEGTVTYTIACTSLILSIPAMDAGGKALLVLLVLGLGLVGFGMHRRLA